MKVLFLLDHDRHGRRDHRGGIGADNEIDFVDVEQLGVDARHGRRIALVIVVDELDLAAEQAALLVGLFFPDLQPSRACLPLAASGPVSAIEKPILIGSLFCAWAPETANIPPATRVAATPASHANDLILSIEAFFPPD